MGDAWNATEGEDGATPIRRGNRSRRDAGDGSPRIVAAPDPVEGPGATTVLRALRRDAQGPDRILFVLTASRRGDDPARYQSPEPPNGDAVDAFLLAFGDVLEGEGRHALRAGSTETPTLLVQGQHGSIHADGDDARAGSRPSGLGFQAGGVAIPVPHGHHDHAA